MTWTMETIHMNVDLINISILTVTLDFLGKEKLKKIKSEGIKKKLMGVNA